MTQPLPALFIAHGNPMNALADNSYTQTLTRLGQQLPTPTAILMISAHWQTDGTQVASSAQPRTIHDFGGFPPELFAQQYPARGAPTLAKTIRQLLPKVTENADMGLDHGAWTVLKFLYPQANIPVLQLSLDYRLSPAAHYALAQALQPLREQGVLIIGSGNIVHNLRAIRWENAEIAPYSWAIAFDKQVQQWLLNRDHAALINYQQLGEAARLSVPTQEHYLPLLYITALQRVTEKAHLFHTGFEYASISMLSCSMA
ncbi:4,5-DOPA dioxygenase extradiol [Beggiatoa leptomitoformis]|uniref:4,5-DOPA dioxygenase extradiol n=1 Tax=Beggiatoa leptomitoformis TaxID=288004 RepID=A0A2N9YG68_9GAMM|nr:4,5-DOPA dioxygenase extradiol [Beggiatoa leptomitoformis]ALG68201.1 4,5-DOPA dioxygenase extradiol [Beggiatoa leptomitoformis]AUI69494.1 4,5-DOPA dioxygenase extradiol [Beggiatoa leptomitoformis]